MAEDKQGWKKCVQFHGHVCPGLATGFQVTRLALEELHVDRAEDEELVAIVENDACGVDAVQALAGCTRGKGNLILLDYGKPVYTFGNRRTGEAVRVVVRRELAPDEPEKLQLVERILHTTTRDYCKVERVVLDFPPKAKLYQSVLCPVCGESVMESRTRELKGQQVCLPCFAANHK